MALPVSRGMAACAHQRTDSRPRGLAVDSACNLYIAEYLNDRVRKVTPDGIITTVAGSDHCCDYGDGGLATDAFVPLPHGIALDSHGNLYIAEWPDSRIRKVTPSGNVILPMPGTEHSVRFLATVDLP